jgi:hypothetical protein
MFSQVRALGAICDLAVGSLFAGSPGGLIHEYAQMRVTPLSAPTGAGSRCCPAPGWAPLGTVTAPCGCTLQCPVRLPGHLGTRRPAQRAGGARDQRPVCPRRIPGLPARLRGCGISHAGDVAALQCDIRVVGIQGGCRLRAGLLSSGEPRAGRAPGGALRGPPCLRHDLARWPGRHRERAGVARIRIVVAFPAPQASVLLGRNLARCR